MRVLLLPPPPPSTVMVRGLLCLAVLLPLLCWQFVVLEGVGHCPQDDRPEVLHKELLPWLKARWQQAAVPAVSS